MQRAIAALFLLAACGCAPVGYVRSGMTPSQAELDERDCRALAQREMLPVPLAGVRPYPYPYYYPRSRPLFGDPLLDRLRNENDLADFCMRARGYRLAPLPSPF